MRPVLTFDEAMSKTYNTGPFARATKVAAPYQLLCCIFMVLVQIAKYPMVGGLSFLAKIPPRFECL